MDTSVDDRLHRMKVIDLTTKTQELHVQLDASPVYDFLAAMYLVENWTADAGFEVERMWVARARAKLGASMRRDLRFFAKKRGVIMSAVTLLAQRPGSSVREFIKAVDATAPGELLERLLTAPRGARTAAPLLREVLHAPKEAPLRAFLAAYPREFDPRRLRALLTMDSGEVKHRLGDLLRGFYGQVYQREEGRVLPLLRADIQTKTSLLAVVPPNELVERATGGYTISPDSGMTHVVLAPAYFFRPYNLLCEYPGVRVFIYPLDVTGAQEASPTRELERVFRALSEQTRLRILQLLSEREMYVQEIADHLGVTHVTAIHHLALLRAAHLVRVVERHNLKYYSLRRETVAEAGTRLAQLLKT